jgi:diguanylate cyclase (GGDEF)-like protein
VEESNHPAGALLRRAALAVSIVLLGLALTTLMAIVQQDAAEREQRLLFEQSVDWQAEALDHSITGHLDGLRDAVSFVSATFPSDVEEYRRYFGQAGFAERLSDLDPGVFVAELIDPADVFAVEEREHALGNDDFVIRFLGLPPERDYLVITRTQRDVAFSGLAFEGLEISELVLQLLGQERPPRGQATTQIQTDSIVARLFAGGQQTNPEDPSILLAVTNSISNVATGEPVGWTIRLLDPSTLVADLERDVDRRLNVEVSMGPLGAPIVLGETDELLLFEGASLAQEVTATTSGFNWTTRIWAASDFAVATGLFDQGATWTFGLLVTLAVLLGAVWRAVQEYQLNRANFELEHARTLASTDSLTGLLNRQGFLDGVRELDEGVSGTLFFIDLDGFKLVNDTQGHEAGDAVLRRAGQVISQQFRGRDLVSRFGGDEFTVFTPLLVGGEEYSTLSERVIKSVSSLDAALSCSVGTATKASYEDVDVLELIRRADEAMYRAKQSGGGRYESSRGSQ